MPDPKQATIHLLPSPSIHPSPPIVHRHSYHNQGVYIIHPRRPAGQSIRHGSDTHTHSHAHIITHTHTIRAPPSPLSSGRWVEKKEPNQAPCHHSRHNHTPHLPRHTYRHCKGGRMGTRRLPSQTRHTLRGGGGSYLDHVHRSSMGFWWTKYFGTVHHARRGRGFERGQDDLGNVRGSTNLVGEDLLFFSPRDYGTALSGESRFHANMSE
ncbi:hypothetical protein L873DRAFT_1115440 [Choiromyces venosus 120613-1]|uniref:Uncharacterized protein n=1 Tax=Choiromyces venosus 120613-1 TaxID=1336337 RepID=A0A3N4JHA7_9PEZI|nr:hypothetical protein L873DRAFT_1115440 [Choiromyces venosus 120613-1]